MSLLEFFHAGGFVMWPLLLLSLGSIAVIIERMVAYQKAPSPAQLVQKSSEAHIERDSQQLALELERNLPLLSATAALAPLLGLLGTVTGMISTFNALATARNSGNTDRVLSGIGEALYATASGIFIALVALAAYSFFTARLRRILAEIEWEASKLETQVAP
jgi:biopolymer transport protein ExbB